jgi:hypothetical protein
LKNIAIIYADDSSVLCITRDKTLRRTAAKSLNEDLMEIQKWADKWNVLFEAAKCKGVTISRLQNFMVLYWPKLMKLDCWESPLGKI